MNIKSVQLFSFFLLLILISCEDDSNFKPLEGLPTTFEIISTSQEHLVLTQLLEQTGLNETLNEGVFTVFAPTDAAFAELDTSTLSNNQLTQLLLYHVIQGNATSGNLSNTYFDTQATITIEGSEHNLDVLIEITESIFLNGSAQVTLADKEASNGTIHVIDQVIELPKLSTFASNDTNLALFFDAISREDQPDFLEILSTSIEETPTPITLFAPTNDAFVTALGLLGLENIEAIEANNLTDIINLHLVYNANLREIDLTEEIIQTQGGNISFDIENGVIIDDNGREIELITKDVQTLNGVLHVLQDVILFETELEDPNENTNLVNFTLDNQDSSAYFVSEINGNEEVSPLNENNSTWTLTLNTRYSINVVNADNHPLELRNENNDVLLAQSELVTGILESDTDIDFSVEGNILNFTLTEELANQLSAYVCSNHANMTGIILVQ